MWSIYLTIDAITVVALLALTILALYQGGYKHVNNRLFAIFSILVAIWIPANHISNNINLTPELALFADYFVFPCSFGAMLVFMFFIMRLAGSVKLRRLADISLWPLIIIGVISATPLVAAGVEVQGNVYAVLFGPLVWLYGVGLLFMIAMTAVAIASSLRSERASERKQMRIVGMGLAVALPLVVIFSFILPVTTGIFSFTEFGITPLIILVVALYYSAVRHSLFDIRLAAVRSLTYVLSLAALSGMYYFIAYLLSTILFKEQASSALSVGPLNIFLALILAFMFQPIRRFFDKITNKIFYRDNYDSDDFFARVNRLLTSTTDLRTLLRRISLEVGGTLKAERASFFVYQADDRYVSVGGEGREVLTIKDARRLDAYVSAQDEGVIIANLLPVDHAIRRLLHERGVAILLPLTQASKVIGYLTLGEQKSGHYTERDVKVLSTISDGLVVAVQNSLSVQEIKDFNEHLQQKIDVATAELRASNMQLRRLDATKDEFVSMASHQLRTPLTSVKGYISMVLEGDAGKISDMQAKLLGEAFTSSERMVHLINDFLNVSRLQTGKFMLDRRQVDLADVVQQEVDSLQTTAKARNIKLQYRMPSVFPVLYLDEGKLRQVIMNFIDNAFYYSREFSTVVVKTARDDGDVVVTVVDSGMGVPEAEQKRLFTKFFRATNARKQRPDGTGVGLFLAKKVIIAHGGTMIFESVEGKGSTFGFRLPIKKLSLAPADDAD